MKVAQLSAIVGFLFMVVSGVIATQTYFVSQAEYESFVEYTASNFRELRLQQIKRQLKRYRLLEKKNKLDDLDRLMMEELELEFKQLLSKKG